MRVLRVVAVGLTLAFGGCAGAGGSASLAAAPEKVATSTGSMSLAISIPNRKPSGAARKPSYVDSGTKAVAFYDGSTLVYAANIDLTSATPFMTLFATTSGTVVTPGTCTRGPLTSTCTFTLSAATGQHTFGLTTYDDLQGGVVMPGSVRRQVSDTGTPPTFTGIIVAEGQLSMVVVGGPNPPQTITLLGVADIAQWFGPQTASFNQTATVGYEIQDAGSSQIITPGNAYDNGPVTITASPSGILTFTPITQTTPPSINGSQTFDVTCTSSSGGQVTFTASAGTQPNTAYPFGITYSSSNYSSGTLSTRGFRCFGS